MSQDETTPPAAVQTQTGPWRATKQLVGLENNWLHMRVQPEELKLSQKAASLSSSVRPPWVIGKGRQLRTCATFLVRHAGTFISTHLRF